MTRIWFFLATIFFAEASFAQTVTVRAGDHAEFTRVVLRVPDGVEWRLGRTSTGYGVRLDQPVDFETGSFFRIIGQDRVREVSVSDDDQQLDLSLNCECSASAYMTDTRWLVVDIALSPPDPESEFEALLDPPETSLATVDPAPLLPTADWEPLEIITPSVEPVQLALPLLLDPPVDQLPALQPTVSEEAVNADRLEQLERAVGASLAEALSQGLLEPSGEVEIDPSGSPNSVLEQLLDDVTALRGPGIAARTSIEPRLLDASESSNSEPGICRSASQLDVPNWGSDQPFTEQIADARNDLVGEFDRPNQTAIEDLAKLYVYFGFGREARAALRIDDVQSVSRSRVASLADIMDDEPVRDPTFVTFMACQTHAAIWGLLAHESGALPYPVDDTIILEAFRALPDHLKSHLAPRLSQKLRQASQDEAARIVLDSALDVTFVTQNAQLERTQALLQIGETEEAVETLEGLVEQDPRASPEALIQLITLQMAEREPVNGDDIVLLQTAMFEAVDPGLKAELATLEIAALTYNEDFITAHSKLREHAALLTPDQIVSSTDELLSNIVQTADDISFLNSVLEDELRGSTAELENGVAERLLGLGFLEPAMELLSTPAIGPEMNERRYLRAEIARISNDTEGVRAELAGIQTQRADDIRLAAGILQSGAIGSRDTSIDGNWQSQDWEELLQSEDPLIQAAAVAALGRPINAVESETPLMASTELIDESARLREIIDGLLNRFETPAE